MPHISLGILNADATTFDFGDNLGNNGPATVGSMQLHAFGISQTLFAYSLYGQDQANRVPPRVAGFGIGTNPAATTSKDWSFAQNANTFTTRRLRIFVEAAMATE